MRHGDAAEHRERRDDDRRHELLTEQQHGLRDGEQRLHQLHVADLGRAAQLEAAVLREEAPSGRSTAGVRVLREVLAATGDG